MRRHLITTEDLSKTEILALFQSAAHLKQALKHGVQEPLLNGQSLAMIFQKPSTRTRVSFEVAMHQLGGHAIKLTGDEIQWGQRESIGDIARTLSRYVNGIMLRTFSHDAVIDFANQATVPVINGLTDFLHPCQALTDFFTIQERLGTCEGKKMAYIGDGNNILRSLITLSKTLGVELVAATPSEYRLAPATDGVTFMDDPVAAVNNADIIYTDTWVSMGQEAEKAARLSAFSGFEVNAALVSAARPDAVVMHCLPAHRGQEITDEVMDSPRSIVFDQAENRLHVQKAILIFLMGGNA